MVVVALIAIAAGVASLALRDPADAQLEREAARLSALLESARAESRSLGVAVVWTPVSARDAAAPGTAARGTVPVSGPARARRCRCAGWTPACTVELPDGRPIVLGPEPLIGPQRIVLRLDDRRLALATDGLGPFEILPSRCRRGRQLKHRRRAGARRAMRGFTLIEVLVALAIVAVTLGAGLQAAGALTRNAQRLAEISEAQWCADNQLGGLRLSRQFPSVGDFDFECEQLGPPLPRPPGRAADTESEFPARRRRHGRRPGAAAADPVDRAREKLMRHAAVRRGGAAPVSRWSRCWSR